MNHVDSISPRASCFCRLIWKRSIGPEISCLEFAWSGPAPRGGQFFLVKPVRSGVFLGRPLSAAAWIPDTPENRLPGETAGPGPGVRFLLVRRGKGTGELTGLEIGEMAELIGPLGNAWGDFLPPPGGAVALIGGGIGIAPLLAFAGELAGQCFDFYAGFRTLRGAEEREGLLGPVRSRAREMVIATEDGTEGRKGRIPDLLDPAKYAAVYACGPEPMLKAVGTSAKQAGVPCFISLERHMACGVGACLGCTVETLRGNRRCCADGPIFNAEELNFDE
ncbi:dihydroorotate dehydrogenase electron transfer subunit [Treponema sp. TIM-1]|uniref:iron-sulfur cluster-binding protein n=1 Tax=Treponema sp. TIM-1 TaxID=2898417 RepID=UPI00397F8834